MKTLSIRIITLLFVASLFATSCKKDDPAPAAGLSQASVQGDWAVTSGEGTEWQEGVGIITPRAADPSLVGYKFSISGNMISVKDVSGTTIFGPISFTIDAGTSTLSAGNSASGLGVYTIKNFVAGTSMDWDQRDPIAEDYEAQAGCSCNLSFQKFLKFSKL